MGLRQWIFGKGISSVGNVVEQVGGVFRPNAEASDAREHDYRTAALAQYAAEFQQRQNRTWFDSLADGLNRLARPIITISVLGMLPAVVIWPERSAIAIQALQLLPTGYWAFVSIIIGFYYGGRMQIKSQEFEKSVVEAVARAPQTIENMRRLRNELSPEEATDESTEMALEIAAGLPATDNQAVLDWRASQK